MSVQPHPVVLLMGPTACGKTELAVRLHAQLPVDVVSVDSAMVYRGMDIGTAKPAPEVLADCPHRLVDICDPSERYSAGRFVRDAGHAIDEILAAGRIPLLVGGTMLYFRALQRGLADLPEADAKVRAAIDAEAAERGWAALHRELADVDPAAAARIKPTDSQRIQRALEVYRLTGTCLSHLQAEADPVPNRRYVKLGLWPTDRASLRARISARFARMMNSGLVEEVRRLHERTDLTPDLPSVRSVGYRQIWAWLDGRMGREEAIERAVTATAQLAKRQLTWMRSEQNLERIPISSAATLEDALLILGRQRLPGLQL